MAAALRDAGVGRRNQDHHNAGLRDVDGVGFCGVTDVAPAFMPFKDGSPSPSAIDDEDILTDPSRGWESNADRRM